jgi:hypothetical protein
MGANYDSVTQLSHPPGSGSAIEGIKDAGETPLSAHNEKEIDAEFSNSFAD